MKYKDKHEYFQEGLFDMTELNRMYGKSMGMFKMKKIFGTYERKYGRSEEVRQNKRGALAYFFPVKKR